MAAAFHATTLKQRIRRTVLHAAATVPLPAQRKHSDRILVMRPDHLGDVLLTTPALRALRAARPAAEIHALVGSWSATVLAGFSEPDMILTLPFPGFTRRDKSGSPYALLLESARSLRRIGYGAALILRPDHWWGALLAYLAGIPRRIGYDLPDVAPFLTDAIAPLHEHAVLQNVRLVEKLTGKQAGDLELTFPVDDVNRAWVDGYLDEWGVRRGTPLIAIHAGSGAWVKQWDEERWAYVADVLANELDGVVALTGSDHELALCQRIAARMKRRPILMAGDTGVASLAALFERCSVVLGSDSGPLHLAVAAGAPTVALFGPADPVEFGSWGDPERQQVLTSKIGCRPCRVLDWGGDDPACHPCVREISAARVLEAARRAMNA
jgi:heptosyltransferase-2/heptosyltransferase-3